MRTLCQILKDEKDYQKLYHCAEKAAVIYPLEDWQIWQMDSLIAMDRQDEAMVLYETTTELLYKELGLTPSDQMKERFRQLEVYQHDKADHVNEIQEGLNQGEKDDGADRALWLKGADHHFLLQPSVCTLMQGFYAGYENRCSRGKWRYRKCRLLLQKVWV